MSSLNITQQWDDMQILLIQPHSILFVFASVNIKILITIALKISYLDWEIKIMGWHTEDCRERRIKGHPSICRKVFQQEKNP